MLWQVECSLQPWRAFKPDGVILFSDILTPLAGMGIEFDIVQGKGPIIADPIRSLEVCGIFQLAVSYLIAVVMSAQMLVLPGTMCLLYLKQMHEEHCTLDAKGMKGNVCMASANGLACPIICPWSSLAYYLDNILISS